LRSIVPSGRRPADAPEVTMADNTSTQPPKDLIGFLDYYLVQKAPFQLPDGAKEWIVKFGPWIALVLIVISLPLLLLALGVSAFILPFAGTAAPGLGLAWVVALPVLFARKMSGWRLLFYGRVVAIVASFLMYSFVGGIIGGIIGLYILFQIRTMYH
jgi:hypothetical protein